ncbi:MAG: hypothetical protein VX843_06095, partial [Actinomycetota bacterium]|nr:hypothetical protein [Actinomycetota bacterium]
MESQRQFSARESTRVARLKRRFITVPAILLSFSVGAVLFLPTILCAFFADALRKKPFPTVRLLAYGLWWLAIESG